MSDCFNRARRLTKSEATSHELTGDWTRDDHTSIVQSVDLRVVKLEWANCVSRPCRDTGDEQQADETGDQTERIESTGDRKDTDSDLRLQHDH